MVSIASVVLPPGQGDRMGKDNLARRPGVQGRVSAIAKPCGEKEGAG